MLKKIEIPEDLYNDLILRCYENISANSELCTKTMLNVRQFEGLKEYDGWEEIYSPIKIYTETHADIDYITLRRID